MRNLTRYLLGFTLLSFAFTACDKKELSMQELLEKTAQEQFFIPENVYAASVRATYFDSLYTIAPIQEKDRFNLIKAEALLYAGKNRDAIDILEQLLKKSNATAIMYSLEEYEEEKISDLLALAYLRLGEQENCLHNHASMSCIIPIDSAGFHQEQEGSSKAISMLENLLTKDAHDVHSQWLLNIAYMTLGKYPIGVPEKWLIPERVFQSEYPLQKFKDIAPKLGLNVNDLSGGGIVDDFNNDNLLDVLVSSWWPAHHLRYFINNGDGTFTEKTETAGIKEITGGLNMVHADYNNDGFLDVFILRGAWMGVLGKHPNSLLRNNGDDTFTDVTIEAGLLSFHPTQTSTWADFNNDGWIDLFVGNESENGNDGFHPCELFLNSGNGTFSDKAQIAGITVSDSASWYYVKGVTAADFNNDGWMDVYVSTLHIDSQNFLFRNNGVNEDGEITFSEVSRDVGLGEKISSFPTWFFDYNNDGWQDIFVAGYKRGRYFSSITQDVANEYLGFPHEAETMRLYQNNKGIFSDVSTEVGLNKIGYAMGANYGDLDNDGYPDIYLSTGEVNLASIIPNRVFRNDSGETFKDVTTAGGFGHLQKGHAVSFSDIDNDGDQDIHVVMGGAFEGDNFFNSLYRNPYQSVNNWVTIIAEGARANFSAIGSMIKITILENERRRTIYHSISSGGSFGCSSLRAEIGLGQATEIEQLEIIWAGSEGHQIFKEIEINKFYKIVEGNTKAEMIHLHPIVM